MAISTGLPQIFPTTLGSALAAVEGTGATRLREVSCSIYVGQSTHTCGAATDGAGTTRTQGGSIIASLYADTRHARFGRPTWAQVETSARLRVRRRRTGGRGGRRPRRPRCAAVTAGEPHSVWASNDLFQNLRGVGLRPCGRREHRRCAPSHMRRRRGRRRRRRGWWWWRWRRRRQRRRAAEAACCGGGRVVCGSPHIKQRTAAAAVMVVVISVCGGRWGWES